MVEFADVWLIEEKKDYPQNNGRRYIQAYIPRRVVTDILHNGGLAHYNRGIPFQSEKNYGEINIDAIWARYWPKVFEFCGN